MSEKPILIVESPSKARTIARYLGDEYEVLACVGHIKDLPPKELGIDIAADFKPTLQVLPDRRDFLKKLKAAAKTAPEVILATDPDREGEAIADHLAAEIPNARLSRVQFTEITRSGITEGLSQRQPIDEQLVDAQMTRRIIDRLVGYKISPVLWNTLQKNMKFVKTALSAGRVQSAAIKMIVDRERQRVAFKKAVYFTLKADLATAEPQQFATQLYELDGQRLATGKDFDEQTGQLTKKNLMLLNRSQTETLARELEPGPWVVSHIDEKPLSSRPSPPFITSTLQQEAARKLRFSARKTMRTAQSLYEAGYITYMRTDSTHLSGEAFDAARREIAERYGPEYLPEKPVQYTSKVKNAQEAHEAIRPAGSSFRPLEEVAANLDKDAARLYDLIRKRTLASQMKPARLKQTTVTVVNQKAAFRAVGKVILFPGFMRAYVESSDDPEAGLADKETVLPALSVNQRLTCEKLVVDERQTKPPARFTEASLVKEMEARGIGRPSTYANILGRIIQKDYVENNKGTLIPTFLAVTVVQLLENHFESLVNAEFTAAMEDQLDAIARGEAQALPFMEAFYYGNDRMIGLEKMLEDKVDIRKACTIPLGSDEGLLVEARIGNYGPYIQKGDQRKTVPASLAPGDLTLETALAILNQDADQPAILGVDPDSGEQIYIKEGPYGAYVQKGDSKIRKGIPKGTDPGELDLELALRLLNLPRSLGAHPETGEEILADYGRYGPYLKTGRTNLKLTAPDTPLNISLEKAITLLSQSRKASSELRQLGTHPVSGAAIVLKEGRYGPFVTDGTVNAALPKNINHEDLTWEQALDLINKKQAAGPTKKRRRKK
ncbi:MAG: type I DNA topoisomerase [Candidatus Neomarinimicrobiota bacterium]